MTDQPSAESIFFQAMEKTDPSERSTFLSRVCAHDALLRKRIEQMIAAAGDLGSFLDRPLGGQDVTGAFAAASPAATPAPIPLEKEGDFLGSYRLVQLLGEGGMGSVWLAEQEKPVKRKVALKIVKAGMDSSRVIARFEAERQALALMDHTSIAKVFDAGRTEAGRPYFVMELVRGVPITQYCDQLQLTIQDRLELLLQVCAAVQHAHQKGVIHRDLKPSNVLVAVQDGKPVPKVIDFGVAKAIHAKLGEQTLATEIGAVLGTLEYMAPEQAELSALDIDTRADLYALGVLLYELLTGSTPIHRGRLQKAAFSEMLRLIKEEEPAKPSTCLSQSKETITTLAAQRRTEPGRLARLITGDLDWIVLKTLEKDRTRRYESVNGLARDLQRFLAHEPVEACPPSRAYRLSKFIKRNQSAVLAGGLLFLALAGGLAGTSIGLVSASLARDAEAKERSIAMSERDEKEKARQLAVEGRIEAEKSKSEAQDQRRLANEARESAEKSLYVNRINLAQQYWLANQLRPSQVGLASCPPERREWEWHYLDRLNHLELYTLPGNGPFPVRLEFNQSGNRLASFSFSADSGVRVWDLLTRKPLTEICLSKIGKSFRQGVFNNDGKSLILLEEDGTLGIWNAETGERTREWKKIAGPVSHLSLSPDGKMLAAAFSQRRNGEMLLPLAEAPRQEDLVVWDLNTGKELHHPKGYGMGALFSPDGTKLFTFKKNTAMRLTPSTPEFFVALFDTATWKEISPGPQLGSWGEAQAFSFSGDGKKLALGGRDRMKSESFIKIFDFGTQKWERTIHPRAVGDIELNQDGSLLASTFETGSTEIALWNLKTGQPPELFRGHTGALNSLKFSPDGRLYSCARDNQIKCWDPKQSRECTWLVTPGKGGAPPAVYAQPAEFSPRGNLLAYSQSQSVSLLWGPARTIHLIDCDSLKPMRTLGGHANGTVQLHFNPTGTRLLSGGRQGDVKIWDTGLGTEIASFKHPQGPITSLALSPDGKWAASAHRSDELARANSRPDGVKTVPLPPLKVWDAQTGKEKWSLTAMESNISRIAFSPDSRLLAVYAYPQINIWDLSTGKLHREGKSNHTAAVDFLAFKDSTHLYTIRGGQLECWNFEPDETTSVLAVAEEPNQLQVALHPNGKRLAIGLNGAVKLWDLETGHEILTISLRLEEKPLERIAALSWTQDGSRLRAALTSGGIVEWNGSPRAGRNQSE